MKLNFFNRKLSKSLSIEKLFSFIIPEIDKLGYDTKIINNPYDLNILGVIKSILFFRSKKATINHITGDIHWLAIFLNPKSTVLTIHDLVGLTQLSGLKRWIFYWFWVYLPIKRLKYITTISQKTKKEIVELLPWAEHKITVIENCLTFPVKKVEKIPHETTQILIVGTRVNKNIETTFSAVKDLPVELTIVGELSKKQLQYLKEHNIRFKNKINISEEELQQIYFESDILCFPSLYEGFGLPILEAQASEVAVITSNISPTKEVAGKGAILVNPLDKNEIKKSIELLMNDAEFKKTLINSGLENIKNYSPQMIAKKYSELYKKMMQ